MIIHTVLLHVIIFKLYRVSRDLFLSEGGKWIRVVYQMCLNNSGSLSFSHSAFPNSSRFLKAIRHYRICQLRSSKHFSGIAVHRKLYKNISSYLICQVPSYSAFSPSLFEILEPPLVLSRLSSPALRVFLILSNETNYYYYFFLSSERK